jgi:hypothetical protein
MEEQQDRGQNNIIGPLTTDPSASFDALAAMGYRHVCAAVTALSREIS